MRATEKLREVATFLKRNGFESASKEAEILLRHGLHLDTVEIYRDNPGLTEEQIKNLDDMVQRRLRREPLQYILGHEEFLGLKLIVGSGVLIPRPETELMAEQVIKAVKAQLSTGNRSNGDLQFPGSHFSIVDLCTGSGCLALAIAQEFPDLVIYGTDISDSALDYAHMNAEINRIKNVRFLKGNLFQPFEEMCTAQRSLFQFDIIISNPPYIERGFIKDLQPEIKEWEPLVALDGGTDGLDFYRDLIPAAQRFLKDGGLIMLETGQGQSEAVTTMLVSSGYREIQCIKDYAGIERIITARCKR